MRRQPPTADSDERNDDRRGDQHRHQDQAQEIRGMTTTARGTTTAWGGGDSKRAQRWQAGTPTARGTTTASGDHHCEGNDDDGKGDHSEGNDDDKGGRRQRGGTTTPRGDH